MPTIYIAEGVSFKTNKGVGAKKQTVFVEVINGWPATKEVICLYETTFLEFVGDNRDHDLATVNGTNTHHGLGSIAIANGKFSNSKFIWQAI